MTDRRAWKQQEDTAIKELVKKYGNKRWALIAQKMTDTYNLKGRSGKQCRQRWHNHLDLSINKNPWTENEEKIIFQSHKIYGNKWTQIAKHLQGRTDNSIKNHFYSTLRRSLRRLNKLLGSKNSTSQMRDIKPSVLSKIFTFADQQLDSIKQQQTKNLLQDCKGVSQTLLQFSGYCQNKNEGNRNKSRNQKDSKISQQDRIKFEGMINQIIKFNTIYQKQKQEKARIKRIMFYNDKSDSSQQQQEQQEQDDEIDLKNTLKIEVKNEGHENMQKRVRKQKKIFQIDNVQEKSNSKKTQHRYQTQNKILEYQQPLLDQIIIKQSQKSNKKQIDIIKSFNHKQQMKLQQFPQLIIYPDQNLSKKPSKQYQFQLNLFQCQNQFNIHTPKLQNMMFSPKLPTPTNCFRDYSKSQMNYAYIQEQMERRLNQIKNQIITNSKKQGQQTQQTNNNINNNYQNQQNQQNHVRSLTFVPSPRSAFKRY